MAKLYDIAQKAATEAEQRAEKKLAPAIASWTAGLSKWNPEVDKFDPARLSASLKGFHQMYLSTSAGISAASAKACRGLGIIDFNFEVTNGNPVGVLCDLSARQNLFHDARYWLIYAANAVKEFGKHIEKCDQMAAVNAGLPEKQRQAIVLKNLKPVIQRCTMGLYYAMVKANAAVDMKLDGYLSNAIVSALNMDIEGMVFATVKGVKDGIVMLVSAAATAVGKVAGYAADLATDALFAVLKTVGLYAAIGIGGYIVYKKSMNKLLGSG